MDNECDCGGCYKPSTVNVGYLVCGRCLHTIKEGNVTMTSKCEHPGGSHSDDLIEVWHGADTPVYGCGYHATYFADQLFAAHYENVRVMIWGGKRREATQLEPATVGATFGPWADHDQRCQCTVCR